MPFRLYSASRGQKQPRICRIESLPSSDQRLTELNSQYESRKEELWNAYAKGIINLVEYIERYRTEVVPLIDEAGDLEFLVRSWEELN